MSMNDVSPGPQEQTVLRAHGTAGLDSLTGLLNRQKFERAYQDLGAGKHAASRFDTFLYMDLDQFTAVNDSYGYEIGDRLLYEVAQLLRQEARPGDLAARLGNDEFGLLLRDCDETAAQQIAARIGRQLAALRIHTQGHTVTVSASMGMVPCSSEIHGFTELMSAANTASTAARAYGRGRVQLYRGSDARSLRRREQLGWVGRINRALEEDRFELHYQRIIPVLASEQGVTKVEVLVRMLDEQGKRVLPTEFIPAAERYGLMPALDRWVIEHALDRLAAGGPGVDSEWEISLNVSGSSLGDESLIELMHDLLQRHRLRRNRICFEITETAAISDFAQAREFIEAMHLLGAKIALDDFGSGMSSFRYLRSLDVDYLKIDGSFISGIDTSTTDLAIADAINNVGHVMGIKTVAEWVENYDILNWLKDLNIDYAQGYLLHAPERWG